MLISYVFLASIIYSGCVTLGEEFPKNFILLVGKGMSIDSVIEARMKEAKTIGKDNSHLLSFETLPCYKAVKTYGDDFMGNSFMSASALFRGTYRLGNSSCMEDEPNTIINSALFANKSTGLVTTMRLTDPLPAILYGVPPALDISECPEFPNRSYTDASHLLVYGPTSSRMDIIFGNGHGILGVDVNDSDHQVTDRHDGRNLTDEWKEGDPNRVYFRSAKEFIKHKTGTGEKYIGTFVDSELSDKKQLAEVVMKAIKVLKSNRNGYLLVVIVDDLDVINTALKLSEVVSHIRRVISAKKTQLIVTSDYIYHEENCNEVLKADENTSEELNNSKFATSKIKILYACNHSRPGSLPSDVPYYSTGVGDRCEPDVEDQAVIGSFLCSPTDNHEYGYNFDMNMFQSGDFIMLDNSGDSPHKKKIIFQLVITTITCYIFF